MSRKDCEMNRTEPQRIQTLLPMRPVYVVVWVMLVLSIFVADSHAGSVRLWPTAVVVSDSIRLSDLCELKGFDFETEKRISLLTIDDPPQPGGSKYVHIEMIRSVLATGGVNMAMVTMQGAIQCAVTRPANTVPPAPQVVQQTSYTTGHARKNQIHVGNRKKNQPFVSSIHEHAENQHSQREITLRNAVIGFFNRELERYQGRAEVVFDHTSAQVLDLSGPTYTFQIRRRQKIPLGLIPLEVDVLTKGRTVQSIPLMVKVTMIRSCLVARRAINQGATIQSTDVELRSLTFNKVDHLGINDYSVAIGQRAKKFKAAGSMIQRSDIEEVPLVVRGQLVSLTSVSGSVQVVTTARAAANGLLGETVKIRAADNKRIEFDAIVVGPGKVQIGTGRVQPKRLIRVAKGN